MVKKDTVPKIIVSVIIVAMIIIFASTLFYLIIPKYETITFDNLIHTDNTSLHLFTRIEGKSPISTSNDLKCNFSLSLYFSNEMAHLNSQDALVFIYFSGSHNSINEINEYSDGGVLLTNITNSYEPSDPRAYCTHEGEKTIKFYFPGSSDVRIYIYSSTTNRTLIDMIQLNDFIVIADTYSITSLKYQIIGIETGLLGIIAILILESYKMKYGS